jgi:hypothetical protein
MVPRPDTIVGSGRSWKGWTDDGWGSLANDQRRGRSTWQVFRQGRIRGTSVASSRPVRVVGWYSCVPSHPPLAMRSSQYGLRQAIARKVKGAVRRGAPSVVLQRAGSHQPPSLRSCRRQTVSNLPSSRPVSREMAYPEADGWRAGRGDGGEGCKGRATRCGGEVRKSLGHCDFSLSAQLRSPGPRHQQSASAER